MDENRQNIELEYKRLLTDNDFERLELLLKEPNIFQVLNIENAELRHSNFLAWLLDPKGTHGLSEVFLVKFLREIFSDPKATKISLVDLPDMDVENAIIHREWRQIDILIELKNTIIAIENKILSKEHSNQLARYKKTVEEMFSEKTHVFVYLTPMGVSSSDDSVFINYDYYKITEHLTEILEINRKSINNSVINYIEGYLNTLKYKVMGTSEINILANKIYKNHKTLFDIVYENKTDASAAFRELLKAAVERQGWIVCSPNKGYVRFLTQELNPLIPRERVESNSWPMKESFLFEINFQWTSKGQVRICSTLDISDTTTKEILKPVLDSQIKPVGSSRWCSYQNTYVKVNYEDVMQDSDDAVERAINEIIVAAKKHVDAIEPLLLSKKIDLLNLKAKQ